MESSKRRPLRTPRGSGIDFDSVQTLFLGSPHGYCTDADWKDWECVVRCITGAISERNCTAPLPECRDQQQLDSWLEKINYIIGRTEHFRDGQPYELIDLDSGSDAYRILFCRKGYVFPKSVLYSGGED